MTGPPWLEPVLSSVNWPAAWEQYVRRNIVSKAAANLIKSFLLKTIAASGMSTDSDESGADQPEYDPDVPALRLSRAKLQELLMPCLLNPEGGVFPEQEKESTGSKLQQSVKNK